MMPPDLQDVRGNLTAIVEELELVDLAMIGVNINYMATRNSLTVIEGICNGSTLNPIIANQVCADVLSPNDLPASPANFEVSLIFELIMTIVSDKPSQ